MIIEDIKGEMIHKCSLKLLNVDVNINTGASFKVKHAVQVLTVVDKLFIGLGLDSFNHTLASSSLLGNAPGSTAHFNNLHFGIVDQLRIVQ